jgi:hypothetical protein
MGMFDTFVDSKLEYETQIKCFYLPIFNGEEPTYDGYYTWHSGGRLAYYNVGDEVPLKTSYYEYPPDFCLIMPTDEYEVCAVESGKFAGFIKKIEEIPDKFSHFYTYHGDKIKASSRNGVIKYAEDVVVEKKKEFDTRDFFELFKSWHEPLTYEQQLGELFDCFQMEQHFIGNEFMGSGLPRVIQITECIEKFREKDPKSFQNFLTKNDLKWGE